MGEFGRFGEDSWGNLRDLDRFWGVLRDLGRFGEIFGEIFGKMLDFLRKVCYNGGLGWFLGVLRWVEVWGVG